MQEPNNDHKTEKHVEYALAVAIGVLLVLVIFVIAQYQSLRMEQVPSPRTLWYSHFLSRHAPLPVNDAGVIRSWMTFDYIDHLFALPPAYLQTKLKITDTRYPRLTISAYAASAGINQAALLNELEVAIRAYSPPKNATSTTTAAPGLKAI